MGSLLLVTAVLLAAPATASAANVDVSVLDNRYEAPTVRIQPGDSVTWSFKGALDHTVTAKAGQTMRFRSKVMTTGGFAQTFADPGRLIYFCEVHGPVMSGAVEVGAPPFPDTLLPRVTGVAAKPGDGRVRLSFGLSERSRVRVALSGPSDRSTSKRLGKGERSIAFRRLRAGAYKATLRPTDGAGNRGKAVTKRFRVD